MPNTFLERLPFVFLFGVAFAVMLAGMGAGAWLLGKLVKALRRLALSPEERQKGQGGLAGLLFGGGPCRLRPGRRTGGAGQLVSPPGPAVEISRVAGGVHRGLAG